MTEIGSLVSEHRPAALVTVTYPAREAIPVRNVRTGTAAGIVGHGPTRRAAVSGRPHRGFQPRLRTPHGNIIT